MLVLRDVYSNSPPVPRTKDENMPTLLYSWWCTVFAMTIIGVRLGGRLVRNDMLFREDKIMALSIIPLLARMAFIHVVLIWQTNNAAVTLNASAVNIHHREIGSRLVLAARVFYALYIWIAKFTVLEFLKRMTNRFWKKSYEWGMRFIIYYLIATFCAVVISTIAECHPITHYWQVVPDPGPQCRQAFAQLITMGVADITTDIFIVVFPIPVILQSAMPLKRKISLSLLFSLSAFLIVITAYRVPAVIAHKGQQQYRTVWASSEILAAAAVSNAVVLGSFLRDRGLKKTKYKFGSITDSIDKSSSRRPTVATLTARHWGSDEDLVADIGYRLDPELQSHQAEPRPAGVVSPLPMSGSSSRPMHKRDDSDMTPITARDWQFPHNHSDSSRESEDSVLKPPFRNASPRRVIEDPMPSPRHVAVVHPTSNTSFFDLGGLLDTSPIQQSRRSSSTMVPSPTPTNSTLHYGANSSSPDYLSGPGGRRGSRSLLSDFGGIIPLGGRTGRGSDGGTRWPLDEVEEHEMTPQPAMNTYLSTPRNVSRSRSRSPHPVPNGPASAPVAQPPIGIPSPRILHQSSNPLSLQDAGGLLTSDTTTTTTASGYFTPASHFGTSNESTSGVSTPRGPTPRASNQQLNPPRQPPQQQWIPTPLEASSSRTISPPIASPNFSRPNLGQRRPSDREGSGSGSSEARSVRFEEG